MTSLAQGEITCLACGAEFEYCQYVKTKTTHCKMRKKKIYWLSFMSVHTSSRIVVSRRILWQFVVKGALVEINRAAGDLWKSSSSPPRLRQISTAVIPDRSLHKVLLSIPIIQTPDLPETVSSSLFFVFTVGNTFLTSNPHSPHAGFIPLLTCTICHG